MTLLVPLGLIVALAAAVVLLLHMRRRRTLGVPSLAIWRRIQTGQHKRTRTLHWPTFSWPLLLQLLAVLLVAAALAQPMLTGSGRVDHWIFVVDHSGAMRAPGANGELLAEAKAGLADRLAAASGGELVSLVAVGESTTPLVARQRSDGPGFVAAIDSIAPEDGRAAWDASGSVLRSLIQAGERTAVIVYSDRAVALPELPAGTVVESSISPPASLANASLSASLEPDPSAPNALILSGTVVMQGGMTGTELVVSYAPEGSTANLEWTRPAVGRPGGEATEAVSRTFDVALELPGPGVVSVALASDGNPSDDRAWFVTQSEARPIRVLYVGDGDQPLVTALRAIKGTEIYQAAGLPADVSDFDLAVIDNRHVSRLPETNALWIGDAVVEGESLTAAPVPSPSAALVEHPLMAGIDWADIAAAEAFAGAPGGEVLLSADGVPLITAAPTAAGRSVRLLFDLKQSTWPRQTSFPVFVANLMDWLGLEAQGLVAPACRVGELCNLDARLAGGTITRLDVPGEPERLSSARFTPAITGLYHVANGSRSLLLAINAAVPTLAASGTVATGTAEFPFALWPWLLALLLLALLAETAVAGLGSERFLRLSALKKGSPLRPRRRTVLALRLATLVLAGFAAFNLHLPLPHWGEQTVQVAAPGGTAGSGPAVAAGPQPILVATGSAPSRGGDGTEAIALAAASLPWGQPGRILVSGRADIDEADALTLGRALLARQLTVVATPPAAKAASAAVTAIEAPAPIYAGDTFPLTGVIHASADGPALISVLRGGQPLVEQQVALAAGDNRIDTLVPDVAPGTADYELHVAADGDTEPADNSFHRSITARPPGRIAVVTTDTAQGAALVGWLGTQGLTAELVEPGKAPYKLADWRSYDGAVLLDLPAITLTTQQQEVLRSAVADEGLGVLILGGPNAFGPGGYLETPLDDISPVSSRVPRDMPEATMVFVLDRSGSMQQPVGDKTRLDVAKTATLAAVRLLNRRSKVGIIVFDAEPTTVFPLQTLDNPEAVGAALSTLDPGGGTSIYPGLKAAYDMLAGVESPARHIVVMTDGLTQPGDFPGLLSAIRAAGITVSTVSIGKGAERDLVAEIARLGDGTFHATDDFAALPSILSQEAMLLSGSPIEEHEAQPLWASRIEPFLRGLPATMPPIHGFVLTTPKPAATLSLAVTDSKGEAMPLLASWRYGNGAVLALTTDAAGPWSAEWQQLDTYPALWSQALRQFLPPVDRGDVVLGLSQVGDGVSATVALAGKADGSALQLVVELDGRRQRVPLQRLTADRYMAKFYPPAEGLLTFTVTAGEATASESWFANYPVHLRNALAPSGIQTLVRATGGDETSSQRNGLRWVETSAWPIWSIAALALLMAELAVRYTSLIPAAPLPTRNASPPARGRHHRTSRTLADA